MLDIFSKDLLSHRKLTILLVDRGALFPKKNMHACNVIALEMRNVAMGNGKHFLQLLRVEAKTPPFSLFSWLLPISYVPER